MKIEWTLRKNGNISEEETAEELMDFGTEEPIEVSYSEELEININNSRLQILVSEDDLMMF